MLFSLFLSELDLFVEPLRITCTMKVKANAVKQEYEKQDELKRSALRALAALAAIPKAGKILLNNNDKNKTTNYLNYVRENNQNLTSKSLYR